MSPFHPPMLRHKRRRGFTLLEVIVATAVFSVLLVGLGSAVMLACRAVPDGKSYSSSVLSAGRAADQIAADVSYATSVSTHTATEMVLTLPDRNGDASPETIRYFWSGTAGDPLLRQFNGGSAVPVAEHVQEFQLGYDVQSVQLPASYSEGAETLLASFTGVTDVRDYLVDGNSWIAQCFTPTLPADAASWSVTRVQLRLSPTLLPLGETEVQLRTTTGGIPGPLVLAETTVAESSLVAGFQWKEIAFTGATAISPFSGVCILLKSKSISASCYVRYDNVAPSGGMAWTGDGGTTWTLEPARSLRYYVYGKFASTSANAYQQLLTSVQLKLRCGTNGASRISTAIAVLNRPQLVGL